MVGNDRNHLEFDGGINLDLRVAMVGIPIDDLNRLLGCINSHLGRASEFSSSIDDAGFENAWPELAAIIEAGDALEESVRVVGHVARACDAVSEIKRAIDV